MLKLGKRVNVSIQLWTWTFEASKTVLGGGKDWVIEKSVTGLKQESYQ